MDETPIDPPAHQVPPGPGGPVPAAGPAPATGTPPAADRLEEEMRRLVAAINKSDNPELYRELVRLGVGCDVKQFRRKLKDQGLVKVRISEVMCLLRVPAVAEAFLAGNLNTHDALDAARHPAKNGTGQAASTNNRNKRVQRQRRLARLEAVLLTLQRLAACPPDNSQAWSLDVGWYRLDHKPAPAAPVPAETPAIIVS